jgi:hypothetical protein
MDASSSLDWKGFFLSARARHGNGFALIESTTYMKWYRIDNMCRRSFIVRIRLRPRYGIVPLSMLRILIYVYIHNSKGRIHASIQCTHFTRPSLDVRQDKGKRKKGDSQKRKGVCKTGDIPRYLQAHPPNPNTTHPLDHSQHFPSQQHHPSTPTPSAQPRPSDSGSHHET